MEQKPQYFDSEYLLRQPINYYENFKIDQLKDWFCIITKQNEKFLVT